MHFRTTAVTVAVALACLVTRPLATAASAEGWTASARSLRCSFSINATGTWKTEGTADAVVAPAALVLIFDSINIEEGTARLRSGSVGADLVARLASGYLHFIQSFRTGSLYTTTVFDRETRPGRLKAVHSRHELYAVALPGSTSSPEQYYGECEVLN